MEDKERLKDVEMAENTPPSPENEVNNTSDVINVGDSIDQASCSATRASHLYPLTNENGIADLISDTSGKIELGENASVVQVSVEDGQGAVSKCNEQLEPSKTVNESHALTSCNSDDCTRIEQQKNLAPEQDMSSPDSHVVSRDKDMGETSAHQKGSTLTRAEEEAAMNLVAQEAAEALTTLKTNRRLNMDRTAILNKVFDLKIIPLMMSYGWKCEEKHEGVETTNTNGGGDLLSSKKLTADRRFFSPGITPESQPSKAGVDHFDSRNDLLRYFKENTENKNDALASYVIKFARTLYHVVNTSCDSLEKSQKILSENEEEGYYNELCKEVEMQLSTESVSQPKACASALTQQSPPAQNLTPSVKPTKQLSSLEKSIKRKTEEALLAAQKKAKLGNETKQDLTCATNPSKKPTSPADKPSEGKKNGKNLSEQKSAEEEDSQLGGKAKEKSSDKKASEDSNAPQASRKSSKRTSISTSNTSSRETKSASSGLESYRYFVKKYKPLRDLEFKGINQHTVNKAMWDAHKSIYGDLCDEECTCESGVSRLCEKVLAVAQEKNATSKTGGGRSTLRDVGFVKFFVRKFYEKVQTEFPASTPSQIMQKLYLMWSKHKEERRFGNECTALCPCIEGWESLFLAKCLKPGKKPEMNNRKQRVSRVQSSSESADDSAKLTDLGSRKKPPSTTLVSSNGLSRVVSSKPNLLPQQKEYSLSFDTSSPLGFYCVTHTKGASTSVCKIISVNPSCSQKDPRLVRGTIVVAMAVVMGTIAVVPKQAVQTHLELKHRYLSAKQKNQKLRLWFVNTEVTAKDLKRQRAIAAGARSHKSHWAITGAWQGHISDDGWAGGAEEVQKKKVFETEEVEAALPSPSVSKPSASLKDLESEEIASSQDTPATLELGSSALPASRDRPTPTKSILHKKRKSIASPGRAKVSFSSDLEFVKQYVVDTHSKGNSKGAGQSSVARTDSEGYTPLTYAVLREDLQKVVDLLLQGSDFEELDDRNKLPIDYASEEMAALRDALNRANSATAITISVEERLDMIKRIREFDLKKKLLKLFWEAEHMISMSRALTEWSSVELCLSSVEDLKLTESGKQHPTPNTIFCKVLSDGNEEKETPVISMSLSSSWPSDKLPTYICRFNEVENTYKQDKSLTVSVFKGTPSGVNTKLGSWTERVEAIRREATSSQLVEKDCKLKSRTEFLLSGCVKLLLKELPTDASFQQTKRKELAKHLRTVITWFEAFRKEAEQVNVDVETSMAIPLCGSMSLLHAAVYLSDVDSIDRLLSQGAQPTMRCPSGTVLELSERLANVSEEHNETHNYLVNWSKNQGQENTSSPETGGQKGAAVGSAQNDVILKDPRVPQDTSHSDAMVLQPVTTVDTTKDKEDSSCGQSKLSEEPTLQNDNVDSREKVNSAPISHAGHQARMLEKSHVVDEVACAQEQQFDMPSPSVLPQLPNADWMLDKRSRRCNNFNRGGVCRFGMKCTFAHVHPPVGKIGHYVPPDDEFREKYFEAFRIPVETCDFTEKLALDLQGNFRFTACFKCPKESTIYLAEKGPKGCKSDQGLYWYPDKSSALDAVRGVVTTALLRRGLISISKKSDSPLENFLSKSNNAGALSTVMSNRDPRLSMLNNSSPSAPSSQHNQSTHKEVQPKTSLPEKPRVEPLESVTEDARKEGNEPEEIDDLYDDTPDLSETMSRTDKVAKKETKPKQEQQNEVILPELPSTDWMLDDCRRCHNFNRVGGCQFGSTCRSAHIHGQVGQVSDHVPSFKEFCDFYAATFGVSIDTRDFQETSETNLFGEMWFTACFMCPKEKTIYLAEKGKGGFENNQGLYWYGDKHSALCAVRRVVATVFLRRGVARLERGKLVAASHESEDESSAVTKSHIHVNGKMYKNGHTEPMKERDQNRWQSKQEAGHSSAILTKMNPPMLVNVDWMLDGIRRCHSFNKMGGCKHGEKCRSAHVHAPVGNVIDHVPSEKEFSRSYKATFGMSLSRHDFMDEKYVDKAGICWFTSAFLCPKEGTYYVAEKGTNGRQSDQGLYWYPDRDSARAAVRRVVTTVLLRRGLMTLTADAREKKKNEGTSSTFDFARLEGITSHQAMDSQRNIADPFDGKANNMKHAGETEREDSNGDSFRDLPFLEDVEWMSETARRCQHFGRKDGCRYGQKCHHLHIHGPVGKTIEQIPSNEEFCRVYSHIVGVPVTSESFHRHTATGRGGVVWFTAAFRCPKENIYYLAEEGDKAQRSEQGLYWYPEQGLADEAVRGVVMACVRKEIEPNPTDHSNALVSSVGTPGKRKFETNDQVQPKKERKKRGRWSPAHTKTEDKYGVQRFGTTDVLTSFPSGVGSILPRLESVDWMLGSLSRCPFFHRTAGCRFGIKCRNAHVQAPVGNMVPPVSESEFSKLYSNILGHQLKSRDFYENSAEISPGTKWFTAAFKCPKEKTIYLAEKGPNAQQSEQGLYWYPNPEQAKAALRAVVVTMLQRRGLVTASDLSRIREAESYATVVPAGNVNEHISYVNNVPTGMNSHTQSLTYNAGAGSFVASNSTAVAQAGMPVPPFAPVYSIATKGTVDPRLGFNSQGPGPPQFQPGANPINTSVFGGHGHTSFEGQVAHNHLASSGIMGSFQNGQFSQPPPIPFQATLATQFNVTATSESGDTFPELPKVDWMLKKSSRCPHFNRTGGCRFKKKCHYAHVQAPVGQLSELVQGEDEFCSMYKRIFGINPDDQDFHVRSGISCQGMTFYTAAFLCPAENTIYYAEKGSEGRQSNQGLYWYPDRSSALASVRGVVTTVMLRRGLTDHESSKQFSLLNTMKTFGENQGRQKRSRPSRWSVSSFDDADSGVQGNRKQAQTAVVPSHRPAKKLSTETLFAYRLMEGCNPSNVYMKIFPNHPLKKTCWDVATATNPEDGEEVFTACLMSPAEDGETYFPRLNGGKLLAGKWYYDDEKTAKLVTFLCFLQQMARSGSIADINHDLNGVRLF